MFPQGGDYNSDTFDNAPNMSMMFTMYTPTFGNGSFSIQAPPSVDNVQSGFPAVPYLPLEAIIYQQQASNPTSAPVNTISGSNTGEQVTSGTQTTEDATGTSRYLFGTQNTATVAG